MGRLPFGAWRTSVARLCQILFAALALPAAAANTGAPIHGLWIWKSSAVLQAPQAAPRILSYCKAATINEVYVSVAKHYSALDELHFVQLIALLHHSDIRVEALLSSIDADEVGGPRTRLVDHVQAILLFNRQHAWQQFDGIHLDIEPQQRPENKGAGNLQFLPGLIDTYRQVRLLTDRAGLTLNADIQNKVLKADLPMRRALLSALPRLTLMLYELSGPEDQSTSAHKIEQVRQSSQRFLEMAYEGLADLKLARMAIALRTADYGTSLAQMLAALDEANRANPHYLGWARHSYNDSLPGMAKNDSP